MCGRYTHVYSWAQLHRLLSLAPGAKVPPKLQKRYNAAPTHELPIVTRDAEGKRCIGTAAWGLRPKGMKAGFAPINARSETVATNAMFKGALQSRRCVVPMNGFYEWQKNGDGTKQPHYIRRADGQPLYVAGLWEPGENGDTFTVLTTQANGLVGELHDRMPVILEPEQIDAWLAAPDASLLKPAADGVLEAFPVSSRVNSPKNDDPSLIDPVEPEGLFPH